MNEDLAAAIEALKKVKSIYSDLWEKAYFEHSGIRMRTAIRNKTRIENAIALCEMCAPYSKEKQ